MTPLQPALVAWLAAANAMGLAMVVFDKRRARRGTSRVPEAAFYGVALLGGWLGAGTAFILLHHKTRKPRFQVGFALCGLVNVVLAWLATFR